jgi:hypothetical protein
MSHHVSVGVDHAATGMSSAFHGPPVVCTFASAIASGCGFFRRRRTTSSATGASAASEHMATRHPSTTTSAIGTGMST